jgi:hypothetical protein
MAWVGMATAATRSTSLDPVLVTQLVAGEVGAARAARLHSDVTEVLRTVALERQEAAFEALATTWCAAGGEVADACLDAGCKALPAFDA